MQNTVKQQNLVQAFSQTKVLALGPVKKSKRLRNQKMFDVA